VKQVNENPAAELTFDVRDEEAERVRLWRLEELQRAGYERKMARSLAERSYVDLHLATALLRRGCPVDTALRILI
jgi:hypothetical protein